MSHTIFSSLFVAIIFSSLLSYGMKGSCPDNCISYYDGCSTCDCTNSNSPICVSKACRSYSTKSCQKCSSNFAWTTCGSICTKTCDDPEPVCISECYEKCECPSDKPILHNGVCIKYEDCFQPPKIQSICPSDCSTYFDGCNFCDCNSDGSMSCTSNACTTYAEPYCATCKNNLQWVSCGSSCTRTCTDTNSTCSDTGCVSRCQCPSNKPLYHNGVCLSLDQCYNFQNVCPNNCTTYNDGCNDCTCLNGQDACTNRTCIAKGTGQCTNCTNGMQWKTCGSSCTKTCSEPSPACDSSCVSKCECPDNKPIYKNGTCIAYSQCNCQCQAIPLPNGKSVDTRVKKCSAIKTESGCKSVKTCLWKCE